MTLKLRELVTAYSLSNHTSLQGQQQSAPSDRTLGMSGQFLSFPNTHLTCHNLIELSPSLECLPSGQHWLERVKQGSQMLWWMRSAGVMARAGLPASLELRNGVRTVSHSPSITAGGQR